MTSIEDDPFGSVLDAICEEAGLTEGSNSMPGTFVLEKAFVG